MNKNDVSNFDRRKERRIDVRNMFLVHVESGTIVKKTELGFLVDISIHGTQFKVANPIKKNQVVSVLLHFPAQLPGPKEIKLRVKAVRCFKPSGERVYSVACEIIHSSAETEERLRQFMWWLDLTADATQLSPALKQAV